MMVILQMESVAKLIVLDLSADTHVLVEPLHLHRPVNLSAETT